jgi:predicted nucleic acid-binding protein
MPYLIDSDLAIDHLANDPAATLLLQQLASQGLAISAITYMEIYEGVLREPTPAARGQAEARVNAFIRAIPVVPISEDIARRCALIRDALRRQNRRVRPRALDLLIAATALEHGLTLVTNNRADYRDVPGITLF